MARKRSLDGGPAVADEILRAAAKLFYTRGYGAVSTRDIAQEVAISSSTIYHHYVNKQEILHAIIKRFMIDFTETILPPLLEDDRSPAARITEAVRTHLEFSQARRPEPHQIGDGFHPQTRSVAGHQARDGTPLQCPEDQKDRGRLGAADPFLGPVQHETLRAPREVRHQRLHRAAGTRLRQGEGPDQLPVARRGSQRRRCSSEPHLRSTMDTMAWTVRTPVKAGDPLPKASFSKPNVTMSHPWPPNSGGRLPPK